MKEGSKMNRKGIPFAQFPVSVKKGILFLITGWGWAVFVQVWHVRKFPLSVLFGLFIIVVVIRIIDWGRILCVFSNAVISVTSLFIAARSAPEGVTLLGVGSFVTAILFGLSTYYLLQRESSDFYRRE
jgi:hypothetical protein